MYWNVQQQEDFEYEMNAREDYIRELIYASGGDTPESLAAEAEWEAEIAADEAAAKGIFDEHVWDYLAHVAKQFPPVEPWEFDDIPF